MHLNLFQILIIISIFQTFFISISFLYKKERTQIGSILFLLITIMYSLQIILQVSLYHPLYFRFKQYYLEFCLMYQTAYLLGPLIYYQLRSTINSHRILQFKNLFHLIPFLLMEIFFVFISNRFDLRIYFNYTRPGIIIHGFIYIIISLRYLKSQNIKFVSLFKMEKPEDFSKFLLFFFVLLWLANLQHFGSLNFFNFTNWCKYVCITYAATLFFLVNITAFLAMVKPKLFIFKKGYANSQLDEQEKEKLYKTLIEQIKYKQLYLNPDLTLKKVSDELNIIPKIISQIINEKQKQNFNEFIITLRIDESKKYLRDKSCLMTIQEIYYASGFNSKSSFNSSFKKHTGLTPKEYRFEKSKQ